MVNMQNKIVLLSMVLTLAACFDESSSSSSSDGQYCRVSETGSSLKFESQTFLGDEKINDVLNYEWSGDYLNVEERVSLSNPTIAKVTDMCQEIKNSYPKTATVVCSETEVNVSISMPLYIVTNEKGEVKRNLQKRCDEFMEDVSEVEQSDYVVTACNAQLIGDTTVIAFNTSTISGFTKSYSIGLNYYSIDQYTGLDDVSLQKICNSLKRDPELLDVTCNGNVFSYYEQLDEAYSNDEILYLGNLTCQALLYGNITLETMLFE